MSSIDLPLSGSIKPTDAIRISVCFAVIYVAFWLVSKVYGVYFGPLSKYPGPKLWAFSDLPRVLAIVQGEEGKVTSELHQKYGPVIRIGPRELSFASGAQAWKDIYGFKKHGQPQPSKHPKFYTKPLNNIDSIITASDANHGRQRKILSHSFSNKSLKEQEPLLKKWATLMRKKLSEHANGTQHIDILKYYNCTTFDIMGDLTFSEGLNMLEDGEYSPWVKTIFAQFKVGALFRGIRWYSSFGNYLIVQFVFKSKTARRKAHEHWRYSSDRVDRRLKRTPEHQDLWTKILERDVKDGGLTLGEHHSNASLFMIAGTETTASALSGTTYHLLQNPDCMRKLTGEIRAAFDDFENVTLESLARLKYMQAVLQEGLRMYPPVPIALPRRTPKEGVVICGEYIPGDTAIGANHMATYRMFENFKYPYEFHPERWLGDPEYKDDHLDALEPFSVGPRNCLGKNLAWHEMRVLLVTMLLHFDLKLCEESSDWSDQKVYTLWEKKPLMCTLRPVKA